MTAKDLKEIFFLTRHTNRSFFTPYYPGSIVKIKRPTVNCHNIISIATPLCHHRERKSFNSIMNWIHTRNQHGFSRIIFFCCCFFLINEWNPLFFRNPSVAIPHPYLQLQFFKFPFISLLLSSKSFLTLYAL